MNTIMRVVKREYLIIGLSWFCLWFGSAFVIKGLMSLEMFEKMVNGRLLVRGYVNLLVDVLVIGIIIYYTRAEWKSGLRFSKNTLDTFYTWLIYALGGLAVVLWGERGISWVVSKFLVFHSTSQNTNSILAMIHVVPLFLVATIVLGPIIEEVIFRKIIFGTLNQTCNFWIASIVSSLLFAIGHGEFLYIPMYMMMGIVMSYVYSKTGHIIVPIMTHVLLNYITVRELI